MSADAGSRAAGSLGVSLSERERALIAAVDPARVEADLRAVVAVPSVTGDEGPVQDLMAALMAEAGPRGRARRDGSGGARNATRTSRASRCPATGCRSWPAGSAVPDRGRGS